MQPRDFRMRNTAPDISSNGTDKNNNDDNSSELIISTGARNTWIPFSLTDFVVETFR